MTEPQNPSPRSRMQALLAIPDNQRTEEQWDELHELEITLAPGNRIGHQEKQNPAGGQGKNRGGNSRGSPPRGEARGGRGGRNNPGQRPPQAAAKSVDAPPGEAAAMEPGNDAAPAKKPFRRFHKKPAKPAAT
jgi:hypothetical protein